jgi:hypothetical protein
MSKESDINKLCGAVLNMSAIHEYNPMHADRAYCPFCYAEKQITINCTPEFTDLEHENNCPYLIAKDLMTNVTPPHKEGNTE